MTTYTNSGNKDTRSGFGAGLYEAGEKNNNIMALCADLTGSLKMDAFAKAFPDRFFEAGIAEANMVGTAAGLALSGKCVFAGSFLAAIFLHSLKKKALFVGVSIVFALILNILRTSFLTLWSLWHGSKALEYDFFGNPTDSLSFTLGTVHDVAGWTAMFITFAMLLLLIPVFNLKMTKTDEEMDFRFADDDVPDER